MAIKMLTKFRRIDEHSENFDKGTENIRKFQAEKNGIREYNNKTEKYMRGFWQETRWSRRKDQWTQRQSRGTYPSDQQKEKRIKISKNSIKDLLDNIKLTNICIITVPEEERDKEAKMYSKK